MKNKALPVLIFLPHDCCYRTRFGAVGKGIAFGFHIRRRSAEEGLPFPLTKMLKDRSPIFLTAIDEEAAVHAAIDADDGFRCHNCDEDISALLVIGSDLLIGLLSEMGLPAASTRKMEHRS
ncbi:hypothetical protein ACLOJK_013272 [Asimina triloba]